MRYILNIKYTFFVTNTIQNQIFLTTFGVDANTKFH